MEAIIFDCDGVVLLAVNPQHCLAVEDTQKGINSAKRAGMQCVGLRSRHYHEVLKEADCVVDRLSDLLRFIHPKGPAHSRDADAGTAPPARRPFRRGT